MKTFFKIAAAMLCVFFIAGCSRHQSELSTTSVPSEIDTAASEQAFPELEVTVMKVGKADAILIETQNHAMLIDTAEEDDISDLKSVLADRQIYSLDCLILTHLDKDHIGGAGYVVSEFDTDRIYQSCNDEDSDKYENYIAACQSKGITPVKLTEEVSFELGKAHVRLLPAKKSFYDNDNDYSIITELQFGNTSFLFTGDAEDARLREYLDDGPQKFDFVKIPHHGRTSACFEEFANTVSPDIAVITCSSKNPPDDDVVNILEESGSKLYLTSDGCVTAVSNGEKIIIRQS